ncbi:MAG: hypothetical protein WBM00_11915 [Solirubrobacterales bacterium]
MLQASRLQLMAGVGVPVMLLALSGCGGDVRRAGTESDVAGQASHPVVARERARRARLPAATVTDPQRRAYIARTDRICRSFDPERGSARKRAGESADVPGAVRAYEEGTALGRSELRRIETVTPPPGDAKLLRANVFSPIRHQLALRARIRNALAAVDLPRLRALRAQLDNISRALSAFGRGYGWRSCGEE